MTFRLRAEVSVEVLGGEATAIDLQTGYYYTAEGSGHAFLFACSRGDFDAESLATFSAQSGSPFEVEGLRASRFLELGRALFEPVEPAEERTAALIQSDDLEAALVLERVLPPAQSDELAHQETLLVEHTDARDLLLLDPIHDLPPARQ